MAWNDDEFMKLMKTFRSNGTPTSNASLTTAAPSSTGAAKTMLARAIKTTTVAVETEQAEALAKMGTNRNRKGVSPWHGTITSL